MKLIRIGTAAASVLLLAATAACSAGSSTTPSGTGAAGAAGAAGAGGRRKTSLTVGLVAEPASLDFTTKDGAAIPQALLDNVYETLVKVDQNGDLKPALAKSWKVSDDGKTYTFELVDNATFTGGVHLHRQGRGLLDQPGEEGLDRLAQGRQWTSSPTPRPSATPSCRSRSTSRATTGSTR